MVIVCSPYLTLFLAGKFCCQAPVKLTKKAKTKASTVQRRVPRLEQLHIVWTNY